MTYRFDTQLAQGEAGEAHLDQIFHRWYNIQPATAGQQRQGIDRWYTRISDQETFPVEYKTDHTAGRTGNAFVETISVDTTQKPGWAYSSQATYLIYFVPNPETIYVLRMADIRAQITDWVKQYPARQIPNRGYHTVGILVPLDEFERIAVAVM